jgi:hypothetical protein
MNILPTNPFVTDEWHYIEFEDRIVVDGDRTICKQLSNVYWRSASGLPLEPGDWVVSNSSRLEVRRIYGAYYRDGGNPWLGPTKKGRKGGHIESEALEKIDPSWSEESIILHLKMRGVYDKFVNET